LWYARRGMKAGDCLSLAMRQAILQMASTGVDEASSAQHRITSAKHEESLSNSIASWIVFHSRSSEIVDFLT
jgi:hypothetical protein